MGDGQASKVVLGMCFVDCIEGYSAYDPNSASQSETLAPALLRKVMDDVPAGKEMGGIAIWANQYSDKLGCEDGCFDAMPGWLDTVCNAVTGNEPPGPTPAPHPTPTASPTSSPPETPTPSPTASPTSSPDVTPKCCCSKESNLDLCADWTNDGPTCKCNNDWGKSCWDDG